MYYKNGKYTVRDFICKICKKTFINKFERKFCSQECYHIWFKENSPLKWRRKYTVDLKAVAKKNKAGFSLVELAKEFGVPNTTLRNYLRWEGYPVYWSNYSRQRNHTSFRKKEIYEDTTAWKSALIRKYGFKCQVCGYDKIIEAHHIVEQVNGGKSTIENGVLLCPNHHAEAHARIINLFKLLKRGKLLKHSKYARIKGIPRYLKVRKVRKNGILRKPIGGIKCVG